MRVVDVERFGVDELLDRIRQVRLRGFDRAQLYADADLKLARAMATDALAPAQRYVLRPGLGKIGELRAALLDWDIDMFALEGGVFVRTSDDPTMRIPVIPPVVEDSLEPDGRRVLVICDGIHRVFAARSFGLPISAVVARGVPQRFPYYAVALEGGWSEVVELDELPEGFQKKEYRIPGNYKTLFRDFNEVFPGVQVQRKRTNPAHLTP